jgi:lipoprotein-anchoring transpeptidase ErfK/SrfK
MKPGFLIDISVDRQLLTLSEDGRVIATYPVSTAAAGVGSEEGSLKTPAGRFIISEKIGGDAPPLTIFESRQPSGLWEPGGRADEDLILSRVLRLAGLDEENANTASRFIYLHGTNREDLIGSPVSHGCIRLSSRDIIELFDLVPAGTPLVIHPPSTPSIQPHPPT